MMVLRVLWYGGLMLPSKSKQHDIRQMGTRLQAQTLDEGADDGHAYRPVSHKLVSRTGPGHCGDAVLPM